MKNQFGKSSTDKKLFNSSFFYFLILSIAAFFCGIWLILIPSDTKGAFLFGFSPLRLFLLIFLLLISAGFAYGAIKIKKTAKLRNSWEKKIKQTRWLEILRWFALAVLFICSSFVLFTPLIRNGLYLSYYQRLLPLATWGLIFSLISPLYIYFSSRPKGIDKAIKISNAFKIAFIVLSVILVLWVIVYITGLGTIPDPAYWDDARPVPLLEGQLWIAWWIALAGILLNFWVEKNSQKHKTQTGHKNRHFWIDLAIFLLIWVISLTLWIQQPIPNSYFTPRVRSPNYEVYPYSDAGLYDTNAQSILLGETAANSRILKRPLYGLFLAGVHVLAGQDYLNVIWLQTIILAFIPSLLFAIGKKIHNRLSGIILAGFSILIEFNTLRVASLATTSNTKLLMTELPTALLLSILIYFLIIWAKQPTKRIYSLVMGGLLGLNILLRSQTLLLLPFILFIALIVLFKKWKIFLQVTLLIIFGVILVIAPWLFRNWLISGKLAIEDPNYTQVVVQLYQSNQPNGTSSLIGNTEGENSGDFFGSAINFIFSNPGEYTKFVANNFLHNEILNVMVLPVRSTPMQTISELTNSTDLFWLNPENKINGLQIILLVIYLGLISLGIATAYNHLKITGLIPLVVHLGYNLSNALSRISGWRFILPVQWVLVLYFCIGMGQILIWFIAFFGFSAEKLTSLFLISSSQNQPKSLESNYSSKPIIIWGLIFGLVGFSVPGIIQLIPRPFSKQNRADLIQELFANSEWENIPQEKNEFAKLLSNNNLVIEKGMAFYPRFYNAQDGEPSRNTSIYQFRDYPRLIFVLIGNTRREIMLPMSKSPQYFPNSSEITIVGRQIGDEFETLLVDLESKIPTLYFANLSLH
jgi:hypothetical protein